jgi:hypothetical protein
VKPADKRLAQISANDTSTYISKLYRQIIKALPDQMQITAGLDLSGTTILLGPLLNSKTSA